MEQMSPKEWIVSGYYKGYYVVFYADPTSSSPTTKNVRDALSGR
jgi:hypothetical protein